MTTTMAAIAGPRRINCLTTRGEFCISGKNRFAVKAVRVLALKRVESRPVLPGLNVVVSKSSFARTSPSRGSRAAALPEVWLLLSP